MSLRAKLLSTYLVFVAALALLGAWSAWRLEQAGAVSQRASRRDGFTRQHTALTPARKGRSVFVLPKFRAHGAERGGPTGGCASGGESA